MTTELKLSKRDENGLLIGVDYKFTPEGNVSWIDMIKEEDLYVSKENEEKVQKQYGKSSKEIGLTNLEKKYVFITLAGIRRLANLRGFNSIINKVKNVHFDERYNLTTGCTVTCGIMWIRNFETNNQEVYTTSVAGASLSNVDKFVEKYVETIAENRAFCRAVRNFLNINIVSKEEVGPSGDVQKEEINTVSSGISLSPSNILTQRLKEENWTFAQLQKAMVTRHAAKFSSKPAEWTKAEDIPPNDIWIIFGIMDTSTKKV